MKSWENLLGLWHSRALPPVNSLERCRLWQCLDLSGGMSFPKRAGRSAHGWDLSLLLGFQLWAQGQPQLPCTGISEDPAHSPQQPGLHLVLEGHGGKWGAGVNLRCQRFYTWLCCGFFFLIDRKVMRFTHEHWTGETAQNEQRSPNCTWSHYLWIWPLAVIDLSSKS